MTPKILRTPRTFGGILLHHSGGPARTELSLSQKGICRGIIYLFNYGSVSTCGSSILYICLVGPAGGGRAVVEARALVLERQF